MRYKPFSIIPSLPFTDHRKGDFIILPALSLSVSRMLPVIAIFLLSISSLAFSSSDETTETQQGSAVMSENSQSSASEMSEDEAHVGADLMSYARRYLSLVPKILTHEVYSLKTWVRESLNEPSRRGTPKVVIDLPAPIVKEPETTVSEPEQTKQDEEPVEAQQDDKTEKTAPEILKEEVETKPEKISAVIADDKGELPGSGVEIQDIPIKLKMFFPGKEKPDPSKEISSIPNSAPPESMVVSPPSSAASAEPDKDKTEAVSSLPSLRPSVVEKVVVRAAPADADLKMGKSMTIGASFAGTKRTCIGKQNGHVLFCSQSMTWPEHLGAYFETHSDTYRGTQAIVRYDGKKLTHAHALFLKAGLKDVVSYFDALYGPPIETFNRIVVPFEGRPMDNPTFVWRRNNPVGVSPQSTVLEIRGFDDSRGGFPDMDHGVVRLYGGGSLPIFPWVSPREMMLAKYAIN